MFPPLVTLLAVLVPKPHKPEPKAQPIEVAYAGEGDPTIVLLPPTKTPS